MATIPGFRFDITGASGSQGLLAPRDSWKAYIFPQGGYASQDSTGTLITFDSAAVASRFAANNWIQAGLSPANVRQVAAVGGNSLSVSGAALTVAENDRIFLIGDTRPTVVDNTATYITPNTVIRYRDDDGADIYTNSMVTANSNGLIQGFCVTGVYDVMVQDGSSVNQGSIVDMEVGVPLGISVSDWAVFGSTVTMHSTLGVTGTATFGVATFGATVTIPGFLGSTASNNQGPVDLRLLGFVNVKSWGAMGDSSTNDTAGISLAMTHAYGNSMAGIYFPPGTYRATQIVVKQGMSLLGVGTNPNQHGRGSILQQIAGTNTDFIVSDPGLSATDYQHWGQFAHLRISGNTADTTGSGIKFNCRTGEGLRFEHLQIQNFPESGIELVAGTVPLYCEDLHLFNNGLYGIDIARSGSDINHAVVMNLISGDNNATALIRISTSGGYGSGEAYVITGVKAEKNTAGRQNNVIVLNSMNGSPVVVIAASGRNVVAENANSLINVTGNNCRLTWIGCDIDSTGYDFIVDDDVGSRTFVGNANTSGSLDFGTQIISRVVARNDVGLTIAGGSVSATHSSHTIDTEASAASDDLDTINGGLSGQLLVVRAANSSRTVVLKHNTGNIQMTGATDFSLDNANDTALLFYNGTHWLCLSTASNGT